MPTIADKLSQVLDRVSILGDQHHEPETSEIRDEIDRQISATFAEAGAWLRTNAARIATLAALVGMAVMTAACGGTEEDIAAEEAQPRARIATPADHATTR